MSPRDRPPVRTPSPRQPSGKDLGNQLSPYNLTLQQLELNCCVVWPEEKWPPDWAWFLPRFFSPFCHQWSFGSLPLSPLACLVGDTSFPAISSTWLNRNFLNWTELDDAITEFNNEMPLTENWVFNLVILHYWYYFPILILCSCFVTICIVKSAI